MVHQSSWIISWQSFPRRRKAGILFDPFMGLFSDNEKSTFCGLLNTKLLFSQLLLNQIYVSKYSWCLSHLPPITKTIQARRTRHAGHCWRSKDELISDVHLWTPTYGQAKVGRPARTYIQQLCEDTGCSPEDLPEAMNDREKWRERVRDIRASGTT